MTAGQWTLLSLHQSLEKCGLLDLRNLASKLGVSPYLAVSPNAWLLLSLSVLRSSMKFFALTWNANVLTSVSTSQRTPSASLTLTRPTLHKLLLDNALVWASEHYSSRVHQFIEYCVECLWSRINLRAMSIFSRNMSGYYLRVSRPKAAWDMQIILLQQHDEPTDMRQHILRLTSWPFSLMKNISLSLRKVLVSLSVHWQVSCLS